MRFISPIRDFFHRESASGLLLISAALLGMAVANSPLSDEYFSFLDASFSLGNESLSLKLSTLKVINYLLMTIFFFIVGLEIKRELTAGHLSSLRRALAPLLGALGGMVLPAALYLVIAGDIAPQGWGVPVATDIALAVGLLGLMGTAVAPALRTFLLGLAVIDDIGAILIIALIYSAGIKVDWLVAALATVLLIALVKQMRVRRSAIYILLGVLLWYALYRCGVHPTLAGVILGLMTPNWPQESTDLEDEEDGLITIIDWLMERIHPWSSFLIVPLFAFANTGVKISEDSISLAVQSPIAWAIFAGLVFGKPIGIFLTVVIATRLKVAEYPNGARPSSIFATGSAAGIGFTVAIFIAELAFPIDSERDIAVFAVIGASLISALLSWVIFSFSKKSSPSPM